MITPKRILFVCSGAEPGCDGVGDYTRRLAEEIRERGYLAGLLALNDRFLAQPMSFCENELRVSPSLSWVTRLKIAKDFTADFQPDLLSLQFVGYGFDRWGLPQGLPSRLSQFGVQKIWHVMFHELWVESEGGLKFRILSRLQKLLVSKLCLKLKPLVIHTSNASYQKRLEDAGIASSILPLFGNIPPIQVEVKSNPEEWVFAFFGSLRRGWEPEPLLSRIEEARAQSGKKRCRFISIGRLGDYGESIWGNMERGEYKNFIFEKLGELSPRDVSRQLQSADFGIAVSPLHLIEKSGAVAAMREHGLPLVVNRLNNRLSVSNQKSARGLVLLDDEFGQTLAAAKKGPCRDCLQDVAEIFLRSFEVSQ